MASNTQSISEIRAMILALNSRLDSLTQEQPSEQMKIPENHARHEPPTAETYPPSTKLRWQLDDNNRRVAIILKGGVIMQMKLVENGHYVPTTDARIRQKFATYADWVASLPAGGAVSTELRDTRTSLEKKLATDLQGLTDAERVRKLLTAWNVKSYVRENLSALEKMTNLMRWLRHCRQNLAEITEEDDIKDPRRRHKLTLNVRNLGRKILALREKMSRMTYPQMQIKHAWAIQGTRRLFARSGGRLAIIAERNGEILFDNKWANTFAEHGIDMKPDGKPALAVVYHGKLIEL